MKTLIAITIITLLLALYVVAIRPWLRKKEWAQGFFAWIEPFEIALWRKSETILWARFLVVLGTLPGILSTIGGIDLTPFVALIPEKYRPWLFMLISLSGVVAELLRRDTSKPLEVVEQPQIVAPEVAAAVAKAEIATAVAVETIKEEAKAA